MPEQNTMEAPRLLWLCHAAPRGGGRGGGRGAGTGVATLPVCVRACHGGVIMLACTQKHQLQANASTH